MARAPWRVTPWLIAVLLAGSGPRTGAQATPDAGAATTAPRPAALLDRLPPDLRAHAEVLLSDQGEGARAPALKALADGNLTLALPLLVWVLDNDPSPSIRATLLARLARRKEPEVRAAFVRAATQDPNPRNAVVAVERLQTMYALDAAELMTKRVAEARAAGDTVAARLFAAEQERWLSRRNGTSLPGFLRRPPALFAAKTASRRKVRVLAFGDFGKGSESQKRTAQAMRSFHENTRFDLGITVGDNFYSTGLSRPDDPRWKTEWEDLYGPMRIPVYATLGNHDWGHPDSPAAELMYTHRSRSWRMPAPYYTFTAGPAQFFALDTDRMSEAQLLWLEDELGKSQARWKIVYGHHPIYSNGRHGDSQALIERLLPLIDERADAYVCGHEHDLQHLRTERGLDLFVSGGGGAELRPTRTGPRSLWAQSSNGFTVLEIGRDAMTTRFVDPELKVLYQHTRRPRDVQP